MTRDGIHEKLQQIFREVFDDDALVIGEETNASHIEEWDSLMQINILAAIQDEFGISFPIEEVVAFKNVGDMLDAIARRLA